MPFLAPAALPAVYMLISTALCPQHAPTSLSFTSGEKKPVIEHNRSTRDLKAERGNNNALINAEFPITNGLTRGKISARYEMSFSYQEVTPGKFCFWTEKVSVKMDYTPVVFIASDYPAGSCRYKDTIAHEMRHVRMDRDTLAEYIPRIKQVSLEAARGTNAPAPPGKKAIEGQKSIALARFKKAFDSIMNQLNADRKIRQQSIDTRAEYLRTTHACAR
ncbi:MAG: hypothetical protein PW788_10370 [Micavibrio sp.]|nr:hypothetical protein [Micavibrio sp.]